MSLPVPLMANKVTHLDVGDGSVYTQSEYDIQTASFQSSTDLHELERALYARNVHAASRKLVHWFRPCMSSLVQPNPNTLWVLSVKWAFLKEAACILLASSSGFALTCSTLDCIGVCTGGSNLLAWCWAGPWQHSAAVPFVHCAGVRPTFSTLSSHPEMRSRPKVQVVAVLQGVNRASAVAKNARWE